MTAPHLIKGQRAEQKALKYLTSQGLEWIESNYRCPRGEIDLIMKEDETLVFIEVRFRKKADFGSGIETIYANKQHRIIHSALHYLQKHQLYDAIDCRFDCIGLNQSGKITWIKDAFQVQY